MTGIVSIVSRYMNITSSKSLLTANPWARVQQTAVSRDFEDRRAKNLAATRASAAAKPFQKPLSEVHEVP